MYPRENTRVPHDPILRCALLLPCITSLPPFCFSSRYIYWIISALRSFIIRPWRSSCEPPIYHQVLQVGLIHPPPFHPSIFPRNPYRIIQFIEAAPSRIHLINQTRYFSIPYSFDSSIHWDPSEINERSMMYFS